MTNIETGNSKISKEWTRKTAIAILSPVSRSERINNDCGIDKATELMKKGYGLIVVINHFSLKDPPQAMVEIFRHPIMGKKKIIAPIAQHMDNYFYHWLGRVFDVYLKPIATKNTFIGEKDSHPKLNDGLKQYFDTSIELLRKGGIVILAPQGSRMPSLGKPSKATVGTFMAEAKRKDLDGYAFLFIGVGIKGINDYSKKNIKGLNLLKKYTVNAGDCLTSKEMLARAGSKFRNVDRVVFEELRKIIPENYK